MSQLGTVLLYQNSFKCLKYTNYDAYNVTKFSKRKTISTLTKHVHKERNKILFILQDQKNLFRRKKVKGAYQIPHKYFEYGGNGDVTFQRSNCVTCSTRDRRKCFEIMRTS